MRTMMTKHCQQLQENEQNQQEEECETNDSTVDDNNHYHCKMSTNGVLFVQNSFGDYGVALFCPLLDIQETNFILTRNNSNNNTILVDTKKEQVDYHTTIYSSSVSNQKRKTSNDEEKEDITTTNTNTKTNCTIPSSYDKQFLKQPQQQEKSKHLESSIRQNTPMTSSSSVTSLSSKQHIPDSISKSIPLKASISSSSSCLCPTLIGTDNETTDDDDDDNDNDEDSENDTTNAVTNNLNSQQYTSTSTCSSSNSNTIYTSPCFIGSIKKESIDNMLDCPPIVSEKILYEIQYYDMIKLLHQYQFQRCFAIGIHGDSFITLLNNVSQYKYTLLIIKTTCNKIFGGFASEPWQEQSLVTKSNATTSRLRSSSNSSNSSFRSSSTGSSTTSTSGITTVSGGSYYGNGLSFLFAVTNTNNSNNNSTPIITATATSTNEEEQGEHQYQYQQNRSVSIYPWSGTNNYCQICDIRKRTLCMGGVGDFGLLVQNSFTSGRTGSSETYNNPPLLSVSTASNSTSTSNINSNLDCTSLDDNNDGYFEIADFEIYGLAPLSMYI